MNLSDYPEIMKAKDMCKYFRISAPTLRRRWRKGELPKPLIQGREHIWPRWTIEEHLGKRPVEQSPESSIDEIRERWVHEMAAELEPALVSTVRRILKGVPNHAHT